MSSIAMKYLQHFSVGVPAHTLEAKLATCEVPWYRYKSKIPKPPLSIGPCHIAIGIVNVMPALGSPSLCIGAMMYQHSFSCSDTDGKE